jgi:hypothetical protein
MNAIGVFLLGGGALVLVVVWCGFGRIIVN